MKAATKVRILSPQPIYISMFNNLKWEYEWERQMNFFIADDIYFAWVNSFKKYVWPLKDYCLVSQGHNKVNFYYDYEEIFENSRKSLERFLKKKLFKPWVKDCLKDNDILKNYIFNKLVRYNFSELSNEKLLNIFKKFFPLYDRPVRHITVIRILNREVQKRLNDYFNNKFKPQDIAAEILNILTSPEKLSIDALEEIDFLKILKKKSQKDFSLLLRRHLDKYLWLPVGYLDEKEWDMAYLRKRVKDFSMKKINPDKRIGEIEDRIKNIKEQKKKLIKKYKIDREIMEICQLVAWGAYFKDLIRERINMGHYYTRPLFKEIAKRKGLTFKEIKNLGFKEIVEMLGKGKNFSERIKQRKNEFIVLCLNGKRKEIYDRDKIKKFISGLKDKSEGKVIKGLSVSLGKASGPVLNINKQTGQVKQKGYVLVTTMTTPELVPLLRDAVAVVTDEGGLTCHAAIVSRELKIPCIVGTKVATQALKDGDLVEVDADKGIVKILKKKK